MPEIIQDWLGTRLGVILDLAPEKFGWNTKNGVLLARLLYSYGVIPLNILHKIKESKNYYDCYDNLKILKPWLHYIGVIQDDSALQRVARGECSSAISLFYAVYLNLEEKNTLDYLLVQKERRFSEENCKRKFKVEWVPEKNLKDDLNKTEYQDPASIFLNKNETLEWHRAKCKEVKEKILKVKAQFAEITKKRTNPELLATKIASPQHVKKGTTEAEEVIQDIDSFEKKHVQKCPDLTYSELVKLKDAFENQICSCIPNEETAKNIVDQIRHRKRNEVYSRNFQKSMQQMVLDEEWKKLIDEQKKKFEDVIYESLLKQSQYEKQIVSKLCQLRHRKKVFAENKKLIDSLKMKHMDKELNDELTTEMELKETYLSDKELEKKKLAELHRKVYSEKVKARHEFLKSESRIIILSIADISIRISETRKLTGCQIPKAFLKDLKELFFKNMPIFDVLNNYEELLVNDLKTVGGKDEENDEDEDVPQSSCNEMKLQEQHRQSILNETDFKDYINLCGPWMVQLLLPEGPDTETQQVVLGYVVHKLLETKYPVPNLPAHVPIKPMKLTALLQDLELDAYKMFVDLMETCRILVVHSSDAINFVLLQYKQELAVVRNIDITFQNLTNKAFQNKINDEKDNEIKKKVLLLKKEETINQPVQVEPNVLDKETQTPRMIPEDDPFLSMNATIGKRAFEALGAGDPVPDSVIISAIFAYVSYKQNDYDGWILVNYPRLYSQASDLECMLTGYRLMPLTKGMCTLEDVENFNFREANLDPFSSDLFALNRTSQLLPKPNFFVETILPENPKSYFDIFIKLKKSSESNHQLKESSPSAMMEEFYYQQGIFEIYEYITLNFQTIKNIGKTVLNKGFTTGDDGLSVMAKPSEEVFGPAISELNNKWGPSKKKNGKSSQMTMDNESKKMKTKETRSCENVERLSQRKSSKVSKGSKSGGRKSGEVQSVPAKPGDPDWEWATGSQPNSLLLALASLWENMEATFIEDLKDIFFCLRTHRSNVLSYCGFIRTSVQHVMRQSDDKQQVLSDFQQMFNEMDFDLRPDYEIKCELHVRVSELEEALLGIADERKANSVRDISKVTQDGWVADEMANLVNHFLNILQLESDRCLTTCQIIMDYYMAFQQKGPDDTIIDKITISKLQMKDRKYSILSLSPQKKSTNQLLTPKNNEFKRTSRTSVDQGTRANTDRANKTRNWGDRRRKSSDSNILTGAAEVITNILVNLSLPHDGMTPFHNFFKDSVFNGTNEIISIIEGLMSEVRKGDKVVGKNAKKGSENQQTGSNVTIEWETALNNELSRFIFRTKLITARGIFDMNEFLTTILNTLSALTESVNEMYLKEVKSISECCKIFRCCIEEEIPVPVRLFLRADDFYIENDVHQLKMVDRDYEKVVEKDGLSFSIDQLGLLFEKLRRVAPDGEIIKRSLIFILEDLKAFNPEIKNCDCLPKAWKLLDPNDMVDVVNEIYHDLEIVPWKDFIIYSLKIPIPCENEILFMRKMFRDFDPDLTELINRTNYDKIKFWFESSMYDCQNDYGDETEIIKDLLFKMYQVDDHQTNYSALMLAFCKDENPIFGFTKALALVVGKKVSTNEFAGEDFSFAAEEGGESEEVRFFENYDFGSPNKQCQCFLFASENDRKCILKERKFGKCFCGSASTNNHEKEDESFSFSETWKSEDLKQAEEVTSSSLNYYKESDFESVVSSIPIEILSSLFKASFPSLSQLSALLDCKQTFQDTLNSIYDALKPQNDRVEVYKLLRHKFVSRLIQSTNKFKFIKIESIVSNKLKTKKMLLTSSCFPDKDSCDMNFD